MTELQSLVIALANARKAEAATEAAYNECWQRFQADNADLIQARTEAKSHVKALDAAVRDTALRTYGESGDSRPHGAVTIRLLKKLDFVPDAVREWAVTSRRTDLLTVDKAALETAVKRGEVPDVLAFFVSEPNVAISTKLDDYINDELDRQADD